MFNENLLKCVVQLPETVVRGKAIHIAFGSRSYHFLMPLYQTCASREKLLYSQLRLSAVLY